MIRPEIRAAFWRWREGIAGAAACSLGLYWALAERGILSWLGVALAAGGAALALAGWQRGRFRGAGDGPGVVQLDEGRLTYFGPLTGGAIAVREIRSLALDGSARPPHWLIEGPEGSLAIPVSAAGADGLFDVFSRLPGLDMQRVLAVLQEPPSTRSELWRVPRRALPR